MIYTFYSYKGGVGRSMVLANVAELFYQSGLKVLMVDWDLEAPGLENYFLSKFRSDDILEHRGLLDLIQSYKSKMVGVIDWDNSEDLPFENPRNLIINIHPNSQSEGKLYLLSAGRRSGEHLQAYANTVLNFDWKDFYDTWFGEQYFEWLRRQFEKIADVVLIDSRTGVTEMGAVCTYQFSDAVAMFCSANQQSIDGTLNMILRLTRPEVEAIRGHPLSVLVVPARVEKSAEGDRLTKFQNQFNRFFGKTIPNHLEKYINPTNYFSTVNIPYIPYYAFEESLPVLERRKEIAKEITKQFTYLTFLLSRLAPQSSRIWDAIPEEESHDDLGKKIITGRVGDDFVFISGSANIVSTVTPDLNILRGNYLNLLIRLCSVLDFKGIPQLENFSHELLLEDVYVPLLAQPEAPAGETLERRLAGRPARKSLEGELGDLHALPAEAPSLPVEEAVNKFSRVVVLGDPGSGKSTLLKFLALSLAKEKDAPLPILVPLNAFSAALLKDPNLSLQAFLPLYFSGISSELDTVAPLFDLAIARGQTLILLDGLDEVQDNRAHLATKVESFAAEVVSHGGKVVISSRIVGYRQAPLNRHDWCIYTLLDFDREAIETFAKKWCKAFERGTLGQTPEADASAERERQGLLDALEINPGVARLASNPLLLTILALIKRQGGNMPIRRVELYELYLKILISSWSRARALDRKSVGPELDYLQTIAVLSPLALWLREENLTAGLVPEERLVEWLTEYYMSDEWGLKKGEAHKAASEFLKSVHTYSNLLVKRGQGSYGFANLGFEEYCLARGIIQRGQLNLADSLKLIEKHLVDPAWRETILLAVGVWGLVREQPRVAGEVVRAMLTMPCAAKNAGTNVLLAGACLEEVGELGVGRGVAREIQEALLQACRNRNLPPAIQRDAGFSLGRSGWLPPDLDDWVTIPAGNYRIGEDKHLVEIRKPFRIAKYPITNRQYAAFIQAGGYSDKHWWSEMGWSWRIGVYDSKADKKLQDWLASRPAEKRTEPFYWNNLSWNNPLAPVVGVCWFEAEAYCIWLTKQNGLFVRLPTEIEWEAAARGCVGREYPWGDGWDPIRLNNKDSWQGVCGESEQPSTTLVGQFPSGATPEGIQDLAGNVWEWTSSRYDMGKENRVLHGGSWNESRRNTRCASRYRNNPADFSITVGFRLFSPG